MFENNYSADLYVTLVYSKNEFSNIIKEIVEYAVNIIKETYRLRIIYRELVDCKHEFPILIINELEPIVFNEIPSLQNVVKLLLAGLRTSSDRVSDYDNVSNSVLTTHF